MSGGQSATTNTSEFQTSNTQPWTAAQPMLYSILSQLGMAPTGATPQQMQAIQQIVQEAGGVPSFGPQGISAVDQAFNVNTNPQQAALNTGIGALSPVLNANWMNPATNPYLGPAMSTLNQDITQQIEGQAAAAGRPFGTNADTTQALARGLSQGEAGLLTNEFNTLEGQTAGAAGMIPGLTGAITGQQLAPIEAGFQGIQGAGAIPGLLTAPGQSALGAAGLYASSPTINLSNLEGLTLPIAGLGAESQGTMQGTSTTTQNQSPWSNIIGGSLGGLGLLGGTGAFGSGGWLSALMLSDEKFKYDIEQVGELRDDTPVYSFKYKGDPSGRTHIGLLAQDVEQYEPSAVVDFPGVGKFVDYHKATDRARAVGLLEGTLEAA